MTTTALCDALADPRDQLPSDGSIRMQPKREALRHQAWTFLWPWQFLAAGMAMILVLRGLNVWVAFGAIPAGWWFWAVYAVRQSKRQNDRAQLFLIALPDSALHLLGVATGSIRSTGRGLIPQYPVALSRVGLVLTLVNASADQRAQIELRHVGVSVDVTVGPKGQVAGCVLRSAGAAVKVRARGRLHLKRDCQILGVTGLA